MALSGGNEDDVNSNPAFAGGSPLQFALREMRIRLGRPGFWAGLAAVTLVLALSGPFETARLLSFPQLLLYWFMIGASTVAVALFTAAMVQNWTDRRGYPQNLAVLAGGVVAGLPVTLVVLAISDLFFNFSMSELREIPIWTLYCTLISVAGTFLFRLMAKPHPAAAPIAGPSETPRATPRAAPFLRRITKPIGADIISLNAQDHYIEVVTASGRELVLARLGDAERELEGIAGMRVHRSWWVAKRHVASIESTGGRMVLRLANGAEVPVSRQLQKQVREFFS